MLWVDHARSTIPMFWDLKRGIVSKFFIVVGVVDTVDNLILGAGGCPMSEDKTDINLWITREPGG